jgi:hypothetical protein
MTLLRGPERALASMTKACRRLSVEEKKVDVMIWKDAKGKAGSTTGLLWIAHHFEPHSFVLLTFIKPQRASDG